MNRGEQSVFSAGVEEITLVKQKGSKFPDAPAAAPAGNECA